MKLSKSQITVLTVLGVIACVIFSMVAGLTGYLLIDQSNPHSELAQAQPTPQPTDTPNPTTTPVSLPTAKASSTAMPTNTPVVVYLPTETPIPHNEIPLDSLLSKLSEDLNPTDTPTPWPTRRPVVRATATPARSSVSSQSTSSGGATSIPAGEWHYFAMDTRSGQSEFIGLTIKPEDARNGVITFISTNYGPCSVAFGDIPVELEDGKIKFSRFTSHGSVVGRIQVDKDEIDVLIDDAYCTDDLFGVLTRAE